MNAQPQISAAYRLLHAGWVHDGLTLDLYGTVDADGAEVCAMALTGSRIDLEAVMFSGAFDLAQVWLDQQAAGELQQQRGAARAERHQHAMQLEAA